MADIDLTQRADFEDHSARHENNGADEISVEGLSGELADQQDPQSHGNERHTDNYVDDTELGAANGVATLNGNAVLSAAQIPDLAITDTFTVTTEADLTTLNNAQIGDVGIVTDVGDDTNNAFILTGDYSVQNNWTALQTPNSPIQSVNGYTGDVVLGPADIGSPSDSEFNNHSARHESGGADEINVGGLSGTLSDPQDPQSHGNERHTENYADDGHDHSTTGDGSPEIRPDKVDAESQLDPPTVSTRGDIPAGQSGFYYIQDEDTITYRVV